MFIPNNDVKIVCKIESDDGNTIKITNTQQGTNDHNKVKLTTIASNISISDIFHLSSAYYYKTGSDGYLAHHRYENDALKHTNFSYTNVDSILNLFYTSGVLNNEDTDEYHFNFKPENILIYDKPIDFNKYLKGSNFALKLQKGPNIPGFNNIHFLDIYDYDVSKGGGDSR